MRTICWVPAAIALAFFPAGGVHAASGVVAGDSLGVGVSMASGLRRYAHNSVTIRGDDAAAQIRRAGAGSTVFLSLGTNDAVGQIGGLDKGIDRIVHAAERARVKLVWMGPPCVHKAWDTRARALDKLLKARLAGTAVIYVSMRDEAICSHRLRARDGVHFTMKGYHYMWEKARNAANFAPSASPQPKVAAAPAQPEKVAEVETGPKADRAAAARPHKDAVRLPRKRPKKAAHRSVRPAPQPRPRPVASDWFFTRIFNR